MKEKILIALKAKYAKLPFGKKAFEGVADYLEAIVTDEADIDTHVSGVESLLKSFQGDIDSRTRQFRNDAEKWRQSQQKPEDEEDSDKKPNDKQPNPPTPPKPTDPPKPGEDFAAMMTKLLEPLNQTINDLKGELTTIKTTKVVDTRKQELDTILEKAPKSFKESTITAFGYMKDMNDEDFETYKTSLTENVKNIQTEVNQNPSPGAPWIGNQGGSTTAPAKAEVDALTNSILKL